MSITLSQLLERVDPEVEGRVDRARRRANVAIRSVLRDRTRLSLNYEDNGERYARQIQVQVEPGKPIGLEEVVFDDDILVLLELARLRSLLVSGASKWSLYRDTNQMLGFTESIELSPLDPTLFESHEERFAELVRLLETRDPLKKILHLERDVLGVCYFGTDIDGQLGGHIELYWGIIGLASDLLSVEVEDLTIVTLAHELAHAYTLVGFEIDGRQWSSSGLGRTDIAVVEGLAQYFTHVCLLAKRDAFPGAFDAFEKLMEKQALCYHAHKKWMSNYSFEQVRRALLEARRVPEGVSEESFNILLETAKLAIP